MSACFLGEIRLFAATFSPVHWAFCNGSLTPIANNQALYSLLGTAYGGDARITFALPDMRSRIPVHFGNGPGLTPRPIGQRSGQEAVELTTSSIPNHNHNVQASVLEADSDSPVGRILAAVPAAQKRCLYIESQKATSVENMSEDAITATGSGKAHINIMPSICLNFIIALVGDYPSRS